MRDINRIETILKELSKYWKANPHLRLAQIVSNIGRFDHGVFPDVFYLEDELILSSLRKENEQK